MKNTYLLDLWLHGMCALYTEELQMFGNQFPALEQNISRYWSQVSLSLFAESNFSG